MCIIFNKYSFTKLHTYLVKKRLFAFYPFFRVLFFFLYFTLFSVFYPFFRVLPFFPHFTLFSAFYPFPRFTLFSVFYPFFCVLPFFPFPLFRFRYSGSAGPFPGFTPTICMQTSVRYKLHLDH